VAFGEGGGNDANSGRKRAKSWFDRLLEAMSGGLERW
jgi:hypothetical protein